MTRPPPPCITWCNQGAAFSFLDVVLDKFHLQYKARAQTDIAFAMNTEFSLVIANEMKRANKIFTLEEGVDQVKVIIQEEEEDQVKEIVGANIDVIIERGEKLDLLVDKTENLITNSETFRTASRNLDRASKW